MSGSPKNNFVGIEVAMTTMRGVVISAFHETIASRSGLSAREPDHRDHELTADCGIRRPDSVGSIPGWSIGKRIASRFPRDSLTAQDHIHAELMQATGL
jgi:hypothetical protein